MAVSWVGCFDRGRVGVQPHEGMCIQCKVDAKPMQEFSLGGGRCDGVKGTGALD